ncbi:ferritin-like domain-containing protein [Chthonobacter rhizosphaerae]|uniref:ferritin-like domain-containing protein n=1 Tax=Chthonobacter rhizosphaerae TaxID=2735553 RepID=UPI0015EFD49B|nr:ferritin-like domain-containing protein [Chthonobacter rhizosphaerae]
MATENTKVRDAFVVGLRNAHGLEKQALQIMNRQLERMTDYPEIIARLNQHTEETNRQVERLETILGRYGESHSALKDTVMSFMGNMAALGHAPAEDEVLKNTFADLAFEAYEIAAYKSLITMAQSLGDQEAIRLLTESLKEEEATAAFFDQNVSTITNRYLQQSHAA